VEVTSFLSALAAVSFTPDDLSISKGSPELRRKVLDRAILNTRPAYLEVALRYGRAVKSRNKLLSDDGSDALLDAYDLTVAQAGVEVLRARSAYVERFGPRVQARFQEIAHPAPPLSVRYRSSASRVLAAPDDESVAVFAEELVVRRASDRRRRTTSIGPHLDDLELRLDGDPVRSRASQGQHRAIVLALKLAEISDLTDMLGEPPVLLLDDIGSELDATRSRQLFDTIADLDAQVVLTTTDLNQIPAAVLDRLGSASIYDVLSGALTARA
jgi:DNA replication and repair protein RecF